MFGHWANEDDAQLRAEYGAKHGLSAKDVASLSSWFFMPDRPSEEAVVDSGIYHGVDSR